MMMMIAIKTPQLVGIILGCAVFIITIAVVLYLLYASGTWAKLITELNDTGPTGNQKDSSVAVSSSTDQFLLQPELYDELIEARNTLEQHARHVHQHLNDNSDLCIECHIIHFNRGKTISVRFLDWNNDSDVDSLIHASDGRSVFGGCDYNTDLIWGWMSNEYFSTAMRRFVSIRNPSESIDSFKLVYRNTRDEHVVMVDNEIDRVVGMLSLVDNHPQSLSIRLDNIWVTPAYRGKRTSHEALLLVLDYLFRSGYRRVTAEVDSRNIIGRRLLERCGFYLESILYKHRVIRQRNCDTALYVMLNSDWSDAERVLKAFLQVSIGVKTIKAADIIVGGRLTAVYNATEISSLLDEEDKDKHA